MIPHIAVEESIHGLLNSEDQVLAITSIPDDKKGEKLIVIYTEQAGSEETLHTLVFKSEMPNLWKPGKSSYVKTEALPILGSGKLDLKSLREIALNALTT